MQSLNIWYIISAMNKKKPAAATKPPVKKPTAKKKPAQKLPPDSRKKQAMPTERMEKGRRANQAQHDAIVKEVIEFLAKAWPSRKIVRFISEKWGFGERQAENYIQKAFLVFQRIIPSPEVAAELTLEMLYDFKERAQKNGKWIPEMMAIKEIKSIMVPSRVQIGGDPAGTPIKTEHTQIVLSPEDIAEAIAAVENQKE